MPRRSLAGSALGAGLFLLAAGCSQSEGAGPPAPTVPAQALAATASASSPQPRREELAAFAQNLSRKLDRSRGPTAVALPEGGILNVPDGHVAHASVLVRGPDGKLHSACVSSPAEVSALVAQVSAGAEP